MAAPITHIVFSEKLFEKYFLKMDKKEFIVGTSFPDIRYLGVIERSKTHFLDNSLQDILISDSFMAGVKFHSLVDTVREKYMSEKGIYSLFPDSQYASQAVKRFEDVVLRDKINNWKEIAGYFDTVTEGEKKFGIKEEDLIRWNELTVRYFMSSSDSDEVIRRFVADMGRPEVMSDEVIKVIRGVFDKEKAKEIVESFYEKFEELIVDFG